jgi:hypothetical protein
VVVVVVVTGMQACRQEGRQQRQVPKVLGNAETSKESKQGKALCDCLAQKKKNKE